MSKSRRSAVRKYHDRVAGRYDQSYDDAFWQWHDGLTWDYIKPFLPKRSKAPVVDLGCGTGKWMAKLAKSGFAATGVDISPAMLHQASKKLSHQGGSALCEFIQADLCDLSEITAGRFELALAMGDPLGSTRSPAVAMRQVRRILADDGVLVATFDNRFAAIDFYLKSGDIGLLSRFLRDGKTHWLTKNVDERFDLHTFSPLEIRSLASSAGLEVIDMVGKTVLPMRHYRELLESSSVRRQLVKIEKSLARDPAAMGRASHLQVAFRVTGKRGRSE